MSRHVAQVLDKLDIKELSHFLLSVSPRNGYCWPHKAKESAFHLSWIGTPRPPKSSSVPRFPRGANYGRKFLGYLQQLIMISNFFLYWKLLLRSGCHLIATITEHNNFFAMVLILWKPGLEESHRFYFFQVRRRQGKVVTQTNSATQHQDNWTSPPRDRLPYICSHVTLMSWMKNISMPVTSLRQWQILLSKLLLMQP